MFHYGAKDLELDFEDDMYHEYFNTNGVDLRVITDWQVLWQAITTELLTPFGSVDSELFSNYGSYIHMLIGEKITDFTERELNLYVTQVLQNYPVDSWTIIFDSSKQKVGQISFELTIYKDGVSRSEVITVGQI